MINNKIRNNYFLIIILEHIQPGFIDPDVIHSSINRKATKNNNRMDFRFVQKQDDEYFNPNSGVKHFFYF